MEGVSGDQGQKHGGATQLNRLDRHGGKAESLQNVDASFGATSRPGRTASGMWERDGVTDAITHVLDQARRSKGEALFVIGENVGGLMHQFITALQRRPQRRSRLQSLVQVMLQLL